MPVTFAFVAPFLLAAVRTRVVGREAVVPVVVAAVLVVVVVAVLADVIVGGDWHGLQSHCWLKETGWGAGEKREERSHITQT